MHNFDVENVPKLPYAYVCLKVSSYTYTYLYQVLQTDQHVRMYNDVCSVHVCT